MLICDFFSVIYHIFTVNLEAAVLLLLMEMTDTMKITAQEPVSLEELRN